MPEVEKIGEDEFLRKKIERKNKDYKKSIFGFLENLKEKSKNLSQKKEEVLDTDQILAQAEEKLRMRDFAAAEKLFLDLVSMNPKEASYYASLGKIYIEQKNLEDAISSFKAAVNRDKKNGFYYNDLGRAFFESGKYKEASICFEKAVIINNKIPNRHIGLGLSFVKMGENKKAAESFRRAVEIEPNNQRYQELYRKALMKGEMLNSG